MDGPVGTAEVVGAFNDAVNRQDVDGMLALSAPDCVLDGTTPPDGERIVGHDALRAFWEDIFRQSPRARVATEQMIVAGDRCTVLLRFVFDADRPDAGHVRGVDVIRVVGGLITEKLSYVKG
jgi:ketosteroid isomerase-like protein